MTDYERNVRKLAIAVERGDLLAEATLVTALHWPANWRDHDLFTRELASPGCQPATEPLVRRRSAA